MIDDAEEEEEEDKVLVDQTSREAHQQPTRGEGDDDDVEESGDGLASASATAVAKCYLRGPARLPQAPLPHNRPVVHPQGTR